MADTALSKEYRINLHLADNVRLEMLMFSHQEHRWIFKHLRRQYAADQQTVLLVQDTRLVVNYRDGAVEPEFELHISLVLPQKRGQLFLYGVDVSPGSLINLTFAYQLQSVESASQYRLTRFEEGSRVHDLTKLEPALIKQVAVPFPLLDTIVKNGWVYRVPFLADDGSERFFSFPDSLCR